MFCCKMPRKTLRSWIHSAKSERMLKKCIFRKYNNSIQFAFMSNSENFIFQILPIIYYEYSLSRMIGEGSAKWSTKEGVLRNLEGRAIFLPHPLVRSWWQDQVWEESETPYSHHTAFISGIIDMRNPWWENKQTDPSPSFCYTVTATEL